MQRRSGESINSEESLLTEVSKQPIVVFHRASETVITIYPNAQNLELYEQLEFTEDTVITEDCERELELPKKQRLHFLDEAVTMSAHSVDAHDNKLKAVKLEHPTPSLHKSKKKKTVTVATQTFLTVRPHIFEFGSRAHVYIEAGSQTLVTCEPNLPDTNIISKLEYNKYVYPDSSVKNSAQGHSKDCAENFPSEALEDVMYLLFGVIEAVRTEIHELSGLDETQKPIEDVGDVAGTRPRYDNIECECIPKERGAAPPTLNSEVDFGISLNQNTMLAQSEDLIDAITGVASESKDSASNSHNSTCTPSFCCYGSTCPSKFTPETNTISPTNQVTCDDVRLPSDTSADYPTTSWKVSGYDDVCCQQKWQSRYIGHSDYTDTKYFYEVKSDSYNYKTYQPAIPSCVTNPSKLSLTVGGCDNITRSSSSFICEDHSCPSRMRAQSSVRNETNSTVCNDFTFKSGSAGSTTTKQYPVVPCDYSTYKSKLPKNVDDTNQRKIEIVYAKRVQHRCTKQESRKCFVHGNCHDSTNKLRPLMSKTGNCNRLLYLWKSTKPFSRNRVIQESVNENDRESIIDSYVDSSWVPNNAASLETLENTTQSSVGTERAVKDINKLNVSCGNDSPSTLLHTNNSLYDRNQNYVFNSLNHIYENNQALFRTGTLPASVSIDNADSDNCCDTVNSCSSHKINFQEQSESINVIMRKSDVLVEIGHDLVEDYATLEATSDNTEYIVKVSSKYPSFARNKTIIIDKNSTTPNRYCHGAIKVSFKCVETQTEENHYNNNFNNLQGLPSTLRYPKGFTENSMPIFKAHTVQSLVEACKDQMRPIRKAITKLSEKMRTVCNPEMRATLEDPPHNYTYNNYYYRYDFSSTSHSTRTHGHYKRKVSFDKNKGRRKFQTRNECNSTSSSPILDEGPSEQQWSSEKELQTLYTCKDTKSSMSTITIDCQFDSCRDYDFEKFE